MAVIAPPRSGGTTAQQYASRPRAPRAPAWSDAAGWCCELGTYGSVRGAHSQATGRSHRCTRPVSQPPPRSLMPQCVLQVLPSVLKAVPHPEDLRICEDSTFVRRVIAAGYGAVHIEEEGAQRVQSRLLRQRATGRSVRRVAPRASQRYTAIATRNRLPSRSPRHAPSSPTQHDWMGARSARAGLLANEYQVPPSTRRLTHLQSWPQPVAIDGVGTSGVRVQLLLLKTCAASFLSPQTKGLY